VIFFDTNVLVYFAINQDVRKQSIAQILIQQAIEKQTLVISPLVIIEFIFVLFKLNQLIEQDKVGHLEKPCTSTSSVRTASYKSTCYVRGELVEP
jgi:predicted nucleic acid-binding protein